MKENEILDNETYYNRTIIAALRIGFIALLFVLSFLILKPFLLLTVWSIIIAVGIYPLFRKLSGALGDKPKLAATVIVIFGVALIVLPSVLLTSSTVQSVMELAEKMQAGKLVIPQPDKSVIEWPLVGKSIYETWNLFATNIDAAFETFAPQLAEFAPKLVDFIMGLSGTILLSIIAVIIAGVLLLHANQGEKTTQRIFRMLIGKDSEEITELVKLTIRSVVQGILGIAFIQSFAAGILMLAFSIPYAGLWAFFVMMLAIMQLPPTIVLLPVGIYAFSIMSTTWAVVFLVLALIISVSDTFLKPIFLGRGVDIPMLVILLGAIGGMIVFGILGLFIGAVALAIAYKVFQALLDDSVWIK